MSKILSLSCFSGCQKVTFNSNLFQSHSLVTSSSFLYPQDPENLPQTECQPVKYTLDKPVNQSCYQGLYVQGQDQGLIFQGQGHKKIFKAKAKTYLKASDTKLF